MFSNKVRVCIREVRLGSYIWAVRECQHEEFMLQSFSKGELFKFSLEVRIVM